MSTAALKLQAISQMTVSLEPVRDTQATFRVLLEAMARPGSVQQLPVAARDAPGNPWLAAVLITLLDHEVALAVEPFDGSDALDRFVRQRTAVAAAPVEQADFVVASGDRLDPTLPLRLRHGSLAYPNDSATLVVLVPTLDQGTGSGISLNLDGPGVPSGHRLRVAGLSSRLFGARDEGTEYPCGIDLVLVDDGGRVAALPRSTRIRIDDPRAEDR